MEKRNIIWVLIAAFVWMTGSTYYYTCNIKGFCKTDKVVKEEEVVVDEYQNDETKFVESETRYIDIEDINNNKQDDVVKKQAEKTTITETTNKTFEKRVIKCYTHINSNIKEGSNNIKSEVEKLERFLNDYYSANLVVDGIYDAEDKAAVIKFQLEKNLDTDGVIGPKTLRVINAVYCVKNENKINN